ncbi:MAG: methyltransferase domain-containing protein [Candidatus Aminicenantes bacterium]|jgi:SAM-dependent methyltransferase|nr:methyltransferase domain-containing protein [Candidatus Aminicenantes bacterium]
MSDKDRKKWLMKESYFGRSWSHIFYRWKCSRIMLGQTTRRVLLNIPHKSRRVIDLGCGSGGNLFEVFDVCSDIKGVQWFGLDLNIREVIFGTRRSRFRVDEWKKRAVNFLAGDLLHLPLDDDSMDMLLCSEVLEHLPEPYLAIGEIVRVLKPGAYAFFTTPNPNNLIERLGFAIDKMTHGALKRTFWKGQDEISAPPLRAEVGFGHVSVYPYRVWRAWLEKAGMKVIRKVRGPMVFGSPFFDQHHFITGLIIALDPLLDRLPCRFLLSINLGILCRKHG